jgi:cell division initiation protein
MDIQQKRFHVGIGFDKKDVTTFFESVFQSYEQLYRSNAELKERVTTLEDTLLNYRTKEESLEKSIMLAEKDSEDKKSKASKEAKSIELDAKNRAKIIIGDAEDRLKEVEAEIEMLKTQYAAYKSSLASLLKLHLTHLKEEDFDADSYIDPKYAGIFMGGGAPAQSGGSFEYGGDPQMRDVSSLGGAGGYVGMSTDADAKATSSEVYTSLMKDNENFVDPFNPDAQANGRYNPYDGRTEKPKEKKPGQSTFTVANGNKNRNNAKVNNAAKKEKAQSPSVKPKEAATNMSETKAADVKPDVKGQNKEAQNKDIKNKESQNKEHKEKTAEEIVNEILKQVTGDTQAEPEKPQTHETETPKAEEPKTEAPETETEKPVNDSDYAKAKAKEFFKKASDTLTGDVEEKSDGPIMIGNDDGDGDDDSEDLVFF